MPDNDDIVEQVRGRVRKKAAESERKDMEERAMECLVSKVGCSVGKKTAKNAKTPVVEDARVLARNELLANGLEYIKQLISDGTSVYIKESISKQIDGKVEGYVQKEAREQTLKTAKDINMYRG